MAANTRAYRERFNRRIWKLLRNGTREEQALFGRQVAEYLIETQHQSFDGWRDHPGRVRAFFEIMADIELSIEAGLLGQEEQN